MKPLVVLLLGQGGYIFSLGIPLLASRLRGLGCETKIFRYGQVDAARKYIQANAHRVTKLVGVGYSLGVSGLLYLQEQLNFDLVLCIADSEFAVQYPINRNRTKRAVLWRSHLDPLSAAGGSLGFHEIHEVIQTHLLMDFDPYVTAGVLDEVRQLTSPKVA